MNADNIIRLTRIMNEEIMRRLDIIGLRIDPSAVLITLLLLGIVFGRVGILLGVVCSIIATNEKQEKPLDT